MGLFDGVATPGASGTGASADFAEMMGWPVLLVLDLRGAGADRRPPWPRACAIFAPACASRAWC